MNCRIRLCAIATSLVLVANTAIANEAKYSISELPKLVSESQHKTAIQRTVRRFEKSHYKLFNINDDFSKKVFERYLETLDYNKLFFTESDIDQLAKWHLDIDDQLNKGDASAAYDIFNLSLRKRFLRYQYALSLLDKEIFFTDDEEMVIDRSKLAWAQDEAELNELWRQRIKNDALNLKLTGKTWPEIKTALTKRYNTALKHLVQTKSEDVFQVYLNAFAREVDPHTSYLSPRTAEQFQSEMNLSLEGIGAVLQADDEYIVIRSLVAGGPAAKSKKLSAGDRIIGVGKDGKKVVDVIGWRLDDVVQLIKGPKGSDVKLEILPEGSNAKSYHVTLVRDKIRLEDLAIKSEVIEQNNQKVGVLTVPSFYVGLAEDAKREIALLKAKGIKGIIVDLRNNGGGALTEATAFTGLFIKSGAVVQVKDSYGSLKINHDTDDTVHYSGPLTVMINRYSASASEIFAAALQDYGRAIIVGEQSFGKGTVQQHRSLNHIYDLFQKPLGHVQYTIQKFYRINGGSTQHKGVIPDIAFPSAVDPEKTGESVEENALPWDSIKHVDYIRYQDLSTILKILSSQHQARIEKDQEFSFVLEDIAQYKRRKDDNTLSLNEKERLNEQRIEEIKRLERINDRQRAEGKQEYKTLEALPKDYEDPDAYLAESVAITLDLANINS